LRPWAGPYPNSPGSGYINPPRFTPPLTPSGPNSIPNSYDNTPQPPYVIPDDPPENGDWPQPERNKTDQRKSNEDYKKYQKTCNETTDEKRLKRDYERIKGTELDAEGNKLRCKWLVSRMNRAQRCAEAREAFDAKWNPGRHSLNVWELKRGYNNAHRDWKAAKCDEKCPRSGKIDETHPIPMA